MRACIGITGHFVTNIDNKLYSAMLACPGMHCSHMAKIISDCFEGTVASYKLSHKLHATVTDNVANMVKHSHCLDLKVVSMIVGWTQCRLPVRWAICRNIASHVFPTLFNRLSRMGYETWARCKGSWLRWLR